MFLEELADLKDRYPARLALHHVLSREQRSAPLLSGRIDEERLRRMLDTLHPARHRRRVVPLRTVRARAAVPGRAGVVRRDARAHPLRAVHHRRAGRGLRRQRAARWSRTRATRRCEIEFTLDGQTSTVTTPVDANESVLNAALRVRPDVPFACAGGVCGTCRARLVSGRRADDRELRPGAGRAGARLRAHLPVASADRPRRGRLRRLGAEHRAVPREGAA